MAYLLTGASGFIGGHLHRALRDVASVDVFDGDVATKADWKPYLRDYDGVIHLAAMVGTADSMQRPGAYVRTNILGTSRMLEAMRGRVGRVVLASSSAVYGECDWLPEDAPHAPQSVYGVTKATQEELCRVSEIPTVVLRLFSVYGPGQDNPHGGVIGMLARAMAEGGAVIYGDGRQIRDFVYVTDVCKAFIAALLAPPGVYNIGRGVRTPVVEAAQYLALLLKAAPPELAGTSRPGDSQCVVADPTKALITLGWKATVGLHDGLERYAKRVLAHA